VVVWLRLGRASHQLAFASLLNHDCSCKYQDAFASVPFKFLKIILYTRRVDIVTFMSHGERMGVSRLRGSRLVGFFWFHCLRRAVN